MFVNVQSHSIKLREKPTFGKLKRIFINILLVEHLCNSKLVCSTGHKIARFCSQWPYDGAQEKEKNVLARLSLSLPDLFGDFEI